MDVDAEPIIDGELIQNTTAKSPAQAASANQSPSLSLTPRASLGTRLAPSRPFAEDVESDVSDDSDDDDEERRAEGAASTNGQAQQGSSEDDEMSEGEGVDPADIANAEAQKNEITEKMGSIEGEYMVLRIRLHKERIKRMQDSMSRIKNGTHRGLRQLVAKFKAEAEQRIRTAKYRRDKQIENAGLILKFKKTCAENDLTARIERAHERTLLDLKHLRNQLLAAKKHMEVPMPTDYNVRPKRQPKKRFVPYEPPKYRERPAAYEKPAPARPRRKQTKTVTAAPRSSRNRTPRVPVVSTPFVVYMLKESEILEDLRYTSNTRSSYKPRRSSYTH